MTVASAETAVRQDAPAPTVGVRTATAIAIADMIGIGVFTSLGFQVGDIPSGFSLLMLWVIGGIMALCGALSYAELAAAFPRSGGEYNFLSRVYRPAVGFLAGWVSATFGFAAPCALAALAFGTYFQGIVPGAPPLLLGLVVIWAVSLILLSGVQQGSKFQDASTLLKIVLIVALIVAGFLFGGGGTVSFAPSARDIGYMTSAPFAISLVFVMYSYSGWNAATYIAGEIRDPQRSVPRSLIIATLVVTALYVGINAAFLYSTPAASMAGQLDVGLVAGKQIFGESGGRIVGGLICIGLVSSVSAMMWIGPRVTMAMGEDIPALSFFAKKTANGVPARALLVQTAIASVLLVTDSFEKVLQFIQFSLTLCSFLAVMGVIVLRFTQPGLPRPYKTWGYPVTPLLFMAVMLWMLWYLIHDKPVQSFAGLAMMLAGLLLYAYWHARGQSRTA
jgi:basic amino acid/polyamine antiporter, APA family